MELTITDGSRLTIKDLPIDTYTVTETNAEGLITGYSVNATVPSVTTGSAATVKDAEVTVVLKNNYERDLGSLELKKTWNIVGKTEVPDAAKNGLRFEITAEGVTGFEPITVYYAQFAGKDTFTVKDLPVGTYTVKEYDYDELLASYGYVFIDGTTEGEEGIVKKGETATVELENNYQQKLGGLTIVKTFNGQPADATDEVLGKLRFEITGPEGYSKTVDYSEFENGAYTLKDLVEGTYEVKETNADELIDNYHLDASSVTEGSAEVSQKTAGEIQLTNTYAPDLGALTIKKTFVGNPTGADLSGLKFTITGGPNNYSETVTYDKFTDGAYTIPNLFAGEYTVKEENAGELIPNYTLVTAASVTTGKTTVATGETATVMLLNIYKQDLGKLTIIKSFDFVGDEPAESLKASLKFHITGPEGYDNTVSYGDFTNGQYTLSKLPVGAYTVTETNADTLIAGYTLLTADSTTTDSATVAKDKTVSVTLTNKYEQDLGNLTIEKTFTGVNPTDDVSGLLFRVIGPNGFDRTVAYSDFDENGKYTFEKITIGDYLVYEINPAYLSPNLTLLKSSKTSDTATVEKGKTATVSLKNDYENSNTSVIIQKVWKDQDDLDGSRPEKLLVTLLADGKEVQVVTLSEGNGWMEEVTDLPLYVGTKLINYSWSEEFVEGYELSSTKTINNLTVLTNSHTPEVISVTVKKVWEDRYDADKMRPLSLAVTLSNGMTVILNKANNWTATIDNLPKFKDGEEIVYTWSEQDILGYTLKSIVVDGNVTTITNYRRPPRVPDVPVTPKPLNVNVIINHVGDCFD